MIRGTVRLVFVIAFCLLLTACQPRVNESASPAPTQTAASLSKTVLMARAEDVYERYLLDLQQVSEDGNKGYERMRGYLSPSAFRAEAQSFDSLSARGVHTVGPSKLTKFAAQRADADRGTVTAYACVDLSKVRLIDRAGKDITPSSRPDKQTFLPSFAVSDGKLRLEKNGTWSGDSVC